MSVSCIDCNEGPEPCGLHPAQPKRVCLGCDGTGRDRGFWVHPPSEPFPIRGEDVCLACQGTGYVSAVVSVKDAIADAETLALTLRELRSFEYTRSRKTAAGRRAEEIGHLLFEAGMNGGSARFQMRTRESWAADGYLTARDAAHAAFRAVPALRGDR